MQNALSGSSWVGFWLRWPKFLGCPAVECVADQSPLKYLRSFGPVGGDWWGLGLGEVDSFEILSDTFFHVLSASNTTTVPSASNRPAPYWNWRDVPVPENPRMPENYDVYLQFYTRILQRQNMYCWKKKHTGGFNCFSCSFWHSMVWLTWRWRSSTVDHANQLFRLDKAGQPENSMRPNDSWENMHTTTSLPQTSPKPWVGRKTR